VEEVKWRTSKIHVSILENARLLLPCTWLQEDCTQNLKKEADVDIFNE
jgi:hypothetical protein